MEWRTDFENIVPEKDYILTIKGYDGTFDVGYGYLQVIFDTFWCFECATYEREDIVAFMEFPEPYIPGKDGE